MKNFILLLIYTPLNIINRTPKGHPVQCSRATLPENQLYQAPIKDGRPDSNVHRCKRRVSVGRFTSLGSLQD